MNPFQTRGGGRGGGRGPTVRMGRGLTGSFSDGMLSLLSSSNPSSSGMAAGRRSGGLTAWSPQREIQDGALAPSAFLNRPLGQGQGGKFPTEFEYSGGDESLGGGFGQGQGRRRGSSSRPGHGSQQGGMRRSKSMYNDMARAVTANFIGDGGAPTLSSDFNEHGDVGDGINETAANAPFGPSVHPFGLIMFNLRRNIRVDITVDGAIRIINRPSGILMALSASGDSAALIHPTGYVYKYGSSVDVKINDPMRNYKYAKLSSKGVSFTSEKSALVYLVDNAGARTTTETFSDMYGDFTIPVFVMDSCTGRRALSMCQEMLTSMKGAFTDDGTLQWSYKDIRISQTQDGLVRVHRENSKFQLRTSPSNGTASVAIPGLHCTASVGLTAHVFVKCGDKRLHHDPTAFMVRNAGHSAGFDKDNQVKMCFDPNVSVMSPNNSNH